MIYRHRYLDGTPVHLPVGKVVCVGRNYAEHARELGNEVPTEPVLFIKPSTAAVDAEGGFGIPKGLGEVHYEAEIALLIGKRLSASADDDLLRSAISGIAPALDLTLRDVQATLKAKGLPWERAKGFDGACVLTRFVLFDDSFDLSALPIRLTVNGEIRQDGSSADMLSSIVPLLRHMAGVFSLLPGDVVLTGTPSGVGPLHRGDDLVLEMPGISRFETRVL